MHSKLVKFYLCFGLGVSLLYTIGAFANWKIDIPSSSGGSGGRYGRSYGGSWGGGK